MLGVITFSIFFGFCFIVLPAILVLIGFLIGFISIYFNSSPMVGEVIILIGTFFWRHFWLTFLTIIGITTGFLVFTNKAQKTRLFKKIKIKNISKDYCSKKG